MRNLTRTGILLAAVAVMLIAGAPQPVHPQTAADAFVVVVNSANSTTSISRSDLSRIFLRRQNAWSDGAPIVPVDRVRSAPLRAMFTKAVHGRSVDAVVTYWQQQIFSGGDLPPVEQPSDEAVLEYVRANPRAIGYVSAGTPLGGRVRKIEIR